MHASGTAGPPAGCGVHPTLTEALPMNAIIYLVGLVVIVLAVLSLIGLR